VNNNDVPGSVVKKKHISRNYCKYWKYQQKSRQFYKNICSIYRGVNILTERGDRKTYKGDGSSDNIL